MARGRISADSTDAVNGSQLYGAVKYLEGKIENAGGGSGDVSIDGDDNIHVTENEGVTGKAARPAEPVPAIREAPAARPAKAAAQAPVLIRAVAPARPARMARISPSI